MNIPVGELETLARLLTVVAGLGGLGWAVLGLNLNISRRAAWSFFAANLLVVTGDVAAQFRGAGVSLLDFYQSFNVSILLILGCVFLFRSGMLELHGLRCRIGRDLLLTAITAAATTLAGVALGLEKPAVAGVFLTAGALSLQGFRESFGFLEKSFSRGVRLALLWPFAAVGLLFLLRAFDEVLPMSHAPGQMNDAMRFRYMIIGLWAQLLIFLLINASLIGQTLNLLFKAVNDQARRLQNILDNAPVGVAVSSGGLIRFANPRATELLDMKAGDPSSSVLVQPELKKQIVAELRTQGTVRDMEIQMYCPQRTKRDLLVTYLPTDYEGKPGILGWMIDITERKKSEKKLLFNRTVVENAEPMFWADPQTLTVVYANKAALAMMEVSAEKIAGIKIPEQFRGGLSTDKAPEMIDRMRDAGRPMRFETSHLRADGEQIDIDVSCYVAEDEERTLVVASMRDISEHKRSDRALRLANDEQGAIFESATLGIAFVKNGLIVRANHKLEELFGWGPGEMLGKSPDACWWPDPGKLLGAPHADIGRGEIHNSTQELTRRDGSCFWCRLSGSAIDANDLALGAVWTFDDVTEERRAAELMREAKELAEEATRMKSDFLANMSHEIRTPMNAIIGMSQLALKTELNPKQRNYLEKVDAAARNLLGIINDILDFSKIEAGKMRFESTEFHLEDVLDTLADLSVIKAQDKGLELLFDVGPDVPTALVGDSLRLGQVMLNLVGNAIKFTERGEITVGIHRLEAAAAAPPDEVVLRFDITDTGVGLSAEQRDSLFTAFSQADASTTRKYGGTGLGLTISKRLVELMDGQIGVSSQPGVGSNFHFTARFGLQAEQRRRETLDAEVTALRILVVDDNARVRDIVMAILAAQKFDATAVVGGEEALAALASAQSEGRPYGLVLIDWMMPGLDGVATIQRMRADARLERTPALMMVTAHSRDELLEQLEGTRIDGLLQKPVGPSSLLDSILCALGKEVVSRGRKQQRQAANQEAEQSLRGAWLLLVEDNPVNQELALEILQAAGIRVDVAENGAEAVGMVGRAEYDGVLMDCQMPVMDGFEATRRIRADARFKELPILAMTANAMSGDRELCLQAGMNDHIGKPIDVNQLFATLARWIRPRSPGADAELAGAAHAGEEALPAIAGLDLNLALRRMGGNAKLLRKLIARFAANQADAMVRITAAIARDDLETSAREAHTTKGLAGNIGANRLLGLAGAVESALKQRRLEELPAALADMSGELAEILLRINAALGAPATEPQAPESEPDREALAGQLQRLAALLAEDDFRAGELAESMAGQLRSAGQGQASAQLKKLIGRYEFEEALESLRQVAQALAIPI